MPLLVVFASLPFIFARLTLVTALAASLLRPEGDQVRHCQAKNQERNRVRELPRIFGFIEERLNLTVLARFGEYDILQSFK